MILSLKSCLTCHQYIKVTVKDNIIWGQYRKVKVLLVFITYFKQNVTLYFNLQHVIILNHTPQCKLWCIEDSVNDLFNI